MDVVKGLQSVKKKYPAGVDLIVADPPYNLKQAYSDYDDGKQQHEYLVWCRSWLDQIYATLATWGSFWLVINDENVIDLDIMARETAFYRQNWVIWYYTFGVARQKGFSRSHTHLFHYTKDPTRFTFNADAIRVPSARQTKYKDKRANPKGKLPDNTWILSPQEEADIFEPIDDTWFFNRICGTYKEREKHSPNQLPVALMERVVLVSSDKDDIVVDPFGGTFTTAVAAKRHGRDFIGFDISDECCQAGRRRLRGESSDKKQHKG